MFNWILNQVMKLSVFLYSSLKFQFFITLMYHVDNKLMS